MKKKELKEENKRYKDWWSEMDLYVKNMIRAANNGKLPIVTDPVNNIQYFEIVSRETTEKIKAIIKNNRLLKSIITVILLLLIFETTLIMILICGGKL